MSHHDQHFQTAPKVLSLDHSKGNLDGSVQLIVKGQGIVTLKLAQCSPFDVSIRYQEWKGLESIRLRVVNGSAIISQLNEGIWETVAIAEGPEAGLDSDPDCTYWFSVDCHNRCVRYGKGETRKNTMIVGFDFSPAPEAPAPDPYAWVGTIREVFFESEVPGAVVPGQVWRDPVTIDPPLSVLPVDKITMDDIALGRATVAANLTPACQQLYANVAGTNFQLNTPEFPHFVDAIEESIRNPNGWCYQTLQKKASEFGVNCWIVLSSDR